MPPKPKEPTKLELEYYALKKEYQAAMDRVHTKYADKVLTLKAKLAVSGKCTHQSVREYDWEGDTGYGRQYWRKGLECQICGLKNQWPDSDSWYDPKNNKGNDY